MNNTEANFRFQPLSFSWVALHPQPKGIVQFIGGAFFGTFPTVFYRYFLRRLFESGYTIFALPFRFSSRHLPIAVSLLQEQENLRQAVIELAKREGFDYEIYQQKSNYFWVGHSLGCKYIALLEFLSDPQYQKIINSCVSENKSASQNLDKDHISIKDQPSLLLAPDISNTESAITRASFSFNSSRNSWQTFRTTRSKN
jgi:hypothetical protein